MSPAVGATVGLGDLRDMKRAGRKIAGVVVWDYQLARIVDRVGVELISVGDSVGVNLFGHRSPFEVTVAEMLLVAKAVRRGTERALLCCDLPFGPLQQGTAETMAAAIELVKQAGVDLIKLDGAADAPHTVTALANAGIPVFAQLGITPHSALRHGLNYDQLSRAGAQVPAELGDELVRQAVLLRDAGAALLDFTNSGPVVGPRVVEAVDIPVLGGFGGGPWLDGRIRMAHAAIGYAATGIDAEPDTYANAARLCYDALTEYVRDVRDARQIRGGVPITAASPAGRRCLPGHLQCRADSVPHAPLAGIDTYYEVTGSGPPLLMFSPGGFDAKLSNWASHGSWRHMNLVAELSAHYTCILFDRREAGRSAGRIERIDWSDYVAQGIALLDLLSIERAHVMGGCVGCTIALALAIHQPERVAGAVLYSPAGGARYRRKQWERFAAHTAFVAEHGFDGLSALLSSTPAGFSADARVGPWCGLLRGHPEWFDVLTEMGTVRYLLTVQAMSRQMFDRDTVSGLLAEDLMLLQTPALIVPGNDESHAPSAAHYLHECLPNSQLWAENADLDRAPSRLVAFLETVGTS